MVIILDEFKYPCTGLIYCCKVDSAYGLSLLTLGLLFEDVMPNLFNVSSSDAAYKKSREFGDKIPIGFLYKVEKPTYDDSFEFLEN